MRLYKEYDKYYTEEMFTPEEMNGCLREIERLRNIIIGQEEEIAELKAKVSRKEGSRDE